MDKTIKVTTGSFYFVHWEEVPEMIGKVNSTEWTVGSITFLARTCRFKDTYHKATGKASVHTGAAIFVIEIVHRAVGYDEIYDSFDFNTLGDNLKVIDANPMPKDDANDKL